MAHDGSGTGWDETAPAGADLASVGSLEIRDLRKAARIRLEKEHVLPAASSVGGEHKEGSAKAYYDTATQATLRPDGATALSADDAGRISFINGKLYVYTGSAWLEAGGVIKSGTVAIDASYSSYIDVNIPFSTIIFHIGSSGRTFTVATDDAADEELLANGIGSSGTLIQITVNSDQITQHRFRVKSADITGTYRYRVFA